MLSNNDGCIISRSDEAKKLGIPMAAPHYKYKHLLGERKGQVFSANYTLYGDMSNKVMTILQTFSSEFEQYSIDEAFLKFNVNDSDELIKLGSHIKETVLKWTGIPISIGFGPTKTLAKVANHMAKKQKHIGVFHLCSSTLKDEVLANFDVSDIWGIGRKWSAKLINAGIFTAEHLAKADIRWIRKNFTIVGERLVRELNGLSCLDLDDIAPKQSIASTRSFGKMVKDKNELLQAISTYIFRACTKLRKQKSKAGVILVFIKTNRFRENDAQYSNSHIYKLPYPSSDTSLMIKAASICLDKIFKVGYNYKKAGIVLLDLVSEDSFQRNLFSEEDGPKREQLMKTLDKINCDFGMNTVTFASQGVKKVDWAMRCSYRSPRYTSNWQELPIVNCQYL